MHLALEVVHLLLGVVGLLGGGQELQESRVVLRHHLYIEWVNQLVLFFDLCLKLRDQKFLGVELMCLVVHLSFSHPHIPFLLGKCFFTSSPVFGKGSSYYGLGLICLLGHGSGWK